MTALPGIVRRFPLLSFVFLACLFGWSLFIASVFGLVAHPSNLPFGPLPAALIVVACQGRSELRAWGRQLRRWRVAPKWYVLAVLGPVLLQLVIVLVNHALGAPLPTGAQLASWPEAAGSLLVFLVLVGIGEETGWTLFAMPILLRRHGMLVAWVGASAMRIFWHLPMMLTGELPWVLGTVGNAAFTMVALQLFAASNGRWTLVAVWHATLNAVGSAYFFLMVTGKDQVRLGFLLSGVYVVVAVVTYLVRERRRMATLAETVIDADTCAADPVAAAPGVRTHHAA